MRQQHRSHREPYDVEDAVGDDLAAVNERLDRLTRQLERIAHANAEPHPAAQADERADHLSNAMARLDRRLDQVIAEGRDPSHEFHRRAQYAPAPQPSAPQLASPPPAPSRGPANFAAQISARQRVLDAPPAAAAAPAAEPLPRRANPAPDNWAVQISARQRALDAAAAAVEALAPTGAPAPARAAAPAPIPAAVPAPVAAAAPAIPAPGPTAAQVLAQAQAQADWSSYLSGLQHQLHHLNAQISSLQQPYQNALGALRGDIADIARALTDATPRRAIETLEGEVRALGERVEHIRQTGAERAGVAALQRELAELRNDLPRFNPAETFGHFDEALRGLHHKIDQIAAAGQPPQIDPMAFDRLEQAVVALRGSNIASDTALAHLAAEVRALGASFERAATESSTEALGRLEAQIAALMEMSRAAQPDTEGSIRELSERLDRMQPSHSDQFALRALEDRIAGLSEKLDTSDSRLGHLEVIERGLADLLVHLEEMRSGNGRGLRAPPAEPAPAPIAPPPAPPVQSAPPRPAPAAAGPAPAPVHSPLDLLFPEAPPEPAMRAPEPPPQPSHQPLPPLAPRAAPVDVEPLAPPESVRPPVARTMPRGPQRQPIDPNLPPDTPLEPGSGAPRIKPGSAAARIAASEAALGNSRPAAAETGGKSAAIAAARNAARAAYLDTPVKVPKSLDRKPGKWLTWPFKKAAKEFTPEPQVHAPAPPPTLPPMPASTPPAMASAMPPPPLDEGDDASPPRGKKALKLLKTLLIAGSVAVIIAGVAQVAMEYLLPNRIAAPAVLPPKDQSQSPIEPNTQTPTTMPGRSAPALEAPPQAPSEADPDSTNSINRGSSFFDPSTAIKLPDVTGSIPRNAPPARTPASAPAGQSNIDAVPASVSATLRAAIAANDPAAEYELGTRFADGRGVPQSLSEAARWFERAADAGFAPAQFRLGSLKEKGEGLRKDVQAARRLYLAAATKGHAKSMHNLAVLYAEGFDGRPDYKAASEWFRKAAGHGVTDSQYNLAILFARGIGVQTNLVESYRWFALAAASGDADAAKKRDEIAARLDQATLATAKLAVQAFVPEREPAEATNLKVPPGGWDQASAATPSRGAMRPPAQRRVE